jgi:hypothetical protein
MPRRGYGPTPNARAYHYRKTIDLFADAMKLRVKMTPPRNWAVFWRMWSEQLIQRQLAMRHVPLATNLLTRGDDWIPPAGPDEAA